jgi:hypothetical protein
MSEQSIKQSIIEDKPSERWPPGVIPKLIEKAHDLMDSDDTSPEMKLAVRAALQKVEKLPNDVLLGKKQLLDDKKGNKSADNLDELQRFVEKVVFNGFEIEAEPGVLVSKADTGIVPQIIVEHHSFMPGGEQQIDSPEARLYELREIFAEVTEVNNAVQEKLTAMFKKTKVFALEKEAVNFFMDVQQKLGDDTYAPTEAEALEIRSALEHMKLGLIERRAFVERVLPLHLDFQNLPQEKFKNDERYQRFYDDLALAYDSLQKLGKDSAAYAMVSILEQNVGALGEQVDELRKNYEQYSEVIEQKQQEVKTKLGTLADTIIQIFDEGRVFALTTHEYEVHEDTMRSVDSCKSGDYRSGVEPIELIHNLESLELVVDERMHFLCNVLPLVTKAESALNQRRVGKDNEKRTKAKVLYQTLIDGLASDYRLLTSVTDSEMSRTVREQLIERFREHEQQSIDIVSLTTGKEEGSEKYQGPLKLARGEIWDDLRKVQNVRGLSDCHGYSLLTEKEQMFITDGDPASATAQTEKLSDEIGSFVGQRAVLVRGVDANDHFLRMNAEQTQRYAQLRSIADALVVLYKNLELRRKFIIEGIQPLQEALIKSINTLSNGAKRDMALGKLEEFKRRTDEIFNEYKSLPGDGVWPESFRSLRDETQAFISGLEADANEDEIEIAPPSAPHPDTPVTSSAGEPDIEILATEPSRSDEAKKSRVQQKSSSDKKSDAEEAAFRERAHAELDTLLAGEGWNRKQIADELRKLAETHSIQLRSGELEETISASPFSVADEVRSVFGRIFEKLKKEKDKDLMTPDRRTLYSAFKIAHKKFATNLAEYENRMARAEKFPHRFVDENARAISKQTFNKFQDTLIAQYKDWNAKRQKVYGALATGEKGAGVLNQAGATIPGTRMATHERKVAAKLDGISSVEFGGDNMASAIRDLEKTTGYKVDLDGSGILPEGTTAGPAESERLLGTPEDVTTLQEEFNILQAEEGSISASTPELSYRLMQSKLAAQNLLEVLAQAVSDGAVQVSQLNEARQAIDEYRAVLDDSGRGEGSAIPIVEKNDNPQPGEPVAPKVLEADPATKPVDSEAIAKYKESLELFRTNLDVLKGERESIKERAGNVGIDVLRGDVSPQWRQYGVELNGLETLLTKIQSLIDNIEREPSDLSLLRDLSDSMSTFVSRKENIYGLKQVIEDRIPESKINAENKAEAKTGEKNKAPESVAERQDVFIENLRSILKDESQQGGTYMAKLARYFATLKEPVLLDDGSEASPEDIRDKVLQILSISLVAEPLNHSKLERLLNAVIQGRLDDEAEAEHDGDHDALVISETRFLGNERQVNPELYKEVERTREAYLLAAKIELASQKAGSGWLSNVVNRMRKGNDRNLSEDVGMKYQEYLRALETYKAAIADRLNARGDERVEKWATLFDSLDVGKKKKRLRARGATEEEVAYIDALPEADRATAMRTLFQEKTKDRLESKVDGIAYTRNILNELQAQQEGAVEARKEIWSEEKTKAFEKTKGWLARNKTIVKWGVRGGVLTLAACQGVGELANRTARMVVGIGVGAGVMKATDWGASKVVNRIGQGIDRRARASFALKNSGDTEIAMDQARSAAAKKKGLVVGKEAAVLTAGATVAFFAAGEAGDAARERVEEYLASLSESDPDIPIAVDDLDAGAEISEMPEDLAEPLRATELSGESVAEPSENFVFRGVERGDTMWGLMREHLQPPYPKGSLPERVYLDTIDDYLQAASQGDLKAMGFREVGGVYDANKIFPGDNLNFTLLEERGVFERAAAAAHTVEVGATESVQAPTVAPEIAPNTDNASAPAATHEPNGVRPEPRPEVAVPELSTDEVAARLHDIAYGSMENQIRESFGESSNSAYERLKQLQPSALFEYARPAVGGGGNFMPNPEVLDQGNPLLTSANESPLTKLYQGVMDYAASYGVSPEQVRDLAQSMPAHENMEYLLYEISRSSVQEAFDSGAIDLTAAAEVVPEVAAYRLLDGSVVEIPQADIEQLQAQWEEATQASIRQYIGQESAHTPAGKLLGETGSSWSAPRILMESFRENAISGFTKQELSMVRGDTALLAPGNADGLESLHGAVIKMGGEFGFRPAEISSLAQSMPREATVQDLITRMAQESAVRGYASR